MRATWTRQTVGIALTAIAALALGVVLAFNGGAKLLRLVHLPVQASVFAVQAPALGRLSSVALLVFACGFIASGSISPFLYFRF